MMVGSDLLPFWTANVIWGEPFNFRCVQRGPPDPDLPVIGRLKITITPLFSG